MCERKRRQLIKVSLKYINFIRIFERSTLFIKDIIVYIETKQKKTKQSVCK